MSIVIIQDKVLLLPNFDNHSTLIHTTGFVTCDFSESAKSAITLREHSDKPLRGLFVKLDTVFMSV